ncbi:MAG: hypothetical protein A3J38_06530 [Gammaproteobacteria bacterium RIFCSPHIGHO2_12_FULL_45_9]|nr:MAG: hypothetical protein A3J38_06530 [Gammaproteobacteria bacterium RIFCSPHIGHO2_12_FULL_45_9]
MIRVLLVDDHHLVRMCIGKMLAAVHGIKVVGEAASGEEALRLVKQASPQVILMDVRMPGMGGVEATRKLLRQNPELRILVLTTMVNEVYSERVLQNGAAGYITKDCDAEEMLQAIRTVHAGKQYLSPVIANRLALRHVRADPRSAVVNALSERELLVLTMLVQGSSVSEVAANLYLSAKTINSYRYRIFEKLNVKNDIEMALAAVRLGLVEPDDMPASEMG